MCQNDFSELIIFYRHAEESDVADELASIEYCLQQICSIYKIIKNHVKRKKQRNDSWLS